MFQSATTAQGNIPSSICNSAVEVERISQRFGTTTVLQSVDLSLKPGEVVALLGPSGCGKTTLLRLLAGLAKPVEGKIRIDGELVADGQSGRFVPPEKRPIGMVFQDYALWPHMTVAQNVSFPLEMRKVPATERTTRVNEALDLVGLSHLADRAPGTLSGGQQQRVALARAIVARPSLILFDEPLSNLDRELRESLVVDIAALLRKLGMSAVYVTHDHAEAFAIADRVAILRDGDVVQIDTPENLVATPSCVAVAEFLKLGVVLPARRSGSNLHLQGIEHGVLHPPSGFVNDAASGDLFVPRSAITQLQSSDTHLRGKAIRSVFCGDGYNVQLRLANDISIDLFSPAPLRDGMSVGLNIAWDRAFWFPHDRHRRLFDPICTT